MLIRVRKSVGVHPICLILARFAKLDHLNWPWIPKGTVRRIGAVCLVFRDAGGDFKGRALSESAEYLSYNARLLLMAR